jgi:CheY-like chemotaxis protein
MIRKNYDVLLIEDEQVVLDAINRICRAEKRSVDTSLEAGSAIEKIQKNDYRLIVCDLMLPGIDGFEFIEKLQDLKIDIPIIITSGYSTAENAVKAINKGAIDFIPKPFTADEVCSAITRGLKYGEIIESDRQRVPGSVAFVPCPPRYFRLGYMTWVSVDLEGSVIIGATDLFLKTIESVKRIEMLSAHDELIQGLPGASIFSLQEERHPLLAPLSGKILELNHELIKKHTLLEKDPYFRGWIYRLIPSDYEYEIKNLTSCQMALL